ncbi:hypothetical protein GOODEAATRI_001006 [Goodea atripinnis]|uniref:Cytohesin Ubiquitin Protein Inducing domain-containing protein n=1 Tax=Goodea atripinnis TaxID=208336 RepID=A0ABV0MED9_9TELE
MTAIESKEEISDTDSGIILHSGPDSPTSPVKDLTTHTRALKLKHQSLEERLELCLLELRKLCIREAELTGSIPSDFPLMPDEKPPRVRRRIGASFKLDEGLIRQDQQNSPWKESSLDQPYQRATKPQSAHRSRSSSEGCRGRARLPQQRCVPEIMVRSPEFSPPRPYQSSSEDSSSEHSSSSYICSPEKDRPTEIPKLCPPPYGFHFGTQKKELSCFRSLLQSTSQPQSSPGHARPTAENGPLSPQDMEMGKSFQTTPPGARNLQRGTPCQRSILKPPPPYIRLVRTPSLKDYPNHAFRLMPREIVSEELKSWHQRNQLQKFWLNCGEHQSITSPTSPHLPPFEQVGTEHTQILFNFKERWKIHPLPELHLFILT